VDAPKLIDHGGCADIYLLPQGRVMKAFRRRAHTNDVVQDWTDHDAITKAQFRGEALAYEHLQSLPALAVYAPQYFGRADPLAILGSDVHERYVPPCGIVLEFIAGRAQKLALLDPATEERVAEIVEQLKDSLKIDNVWDASCFVPGSRADFTVIDFAYWYAGEYEMALAANGILRHDERAKLERENAD
jgi:hypothetical protein